LQHNRGDSLNELNAKCFSNHIAINYKVSLLTFSPTVLPPPTISVPISMTLFIGTLKMVALIVTYAVPPQNLTTGRPQAIFPTAFPVSEHNYSQSSFISEIIALKIAMYSNTIETGGFTHKN
jgi:hypothetical protein